MQDNAKKMKKTSAPTKPKPRTPRQKKLLRRFLIGYGIFLIYCLVYSGWDKVTAFFNQLPYYINNFPGSIEPLIDWAYHGEMAMFAAIGHYFALLSPAIVVILWIFLLIGTVDQKNRSQGQRKLDSAMLWGIISGVAFYLFQDAALAFLKTIFGIVFVLIFTALGAGGVALPFGFLGFGGWIGYDDWDRYDDNGHRDDY